MPKTSMPWRVPSQSRAQCLHAGFAIRSIIRQNTIALELPDFRNLGTVLRVVLAVNAMTAAAALVREPQFGLWAAQWLEMSATVEPHLIFELAVLYAIAPWLSRQPAPTGALTIAALTVGVGFGVQTLIASQVPQPPLALLRHILLALGVWGVLIAYFNLRARALSPAIAESRLQALQARIRPHFLFNSINAVLSLIRSDPKQAETALEDMADLFRVLMRDNRELVPLTDEIELCRQYLALEKLRLTDRLNVEWHLKSMPGDALVPPLVLQPLLENAVYHGIEPSSAAGVVSINIFYKGGEVHAILRNPYQAAGGRHHAGNKMALGNIRERLKLHFDAEGSLESRVRDAIYEVHIRMPYRSTGSAAPAKGAASADERAKASRDAPAGGTPARPEGPVLADGSRGAPHG
jgi:two-component system sensor histidine kinase AlgZ